MKFIWFLIIVSFCIVGCSPSPSEGDSDHTNTETSHNP